MNKTLAQILVERREEIGQTREDVVRNGIVCGAFLRVADIKRYEEGKTQTIQTAMLKKLSTIYALEARTLEPFLVRRKNKNLEPA